MKLTTKTLKEMVRRELLNVLKESLYGQDEFQKINDLFDGNEEDIKQALYFVMMIAGVTGDIQFDEDGKSYKIILHGEEASKENVKQLAAALKPFADSKGFNVTENWYPEFSVDMYKESNYEEDYDDGSPQGAPGYATDF